MINTTIGAQLKAARLKLGYSQEGAAWTAGLSDNVVSRLERGEIRSITPLIRLATIYGMQVKITLTKE